jgi:nitrogen fixation NifU-like protein
MTGDLYQKELLRFAARARGHGRLDAPDARITLDNPLCGDRVTLEVALEDGHVADVAHDLRACVLCQASASIIGEHAVGADAAEIEGVLETIKAMLAQNGSPPGGRWRQLDVFRAVAGHKNRYTCVTLPFRALGDAIKTALLEKN